MPNFCEPSMTRSLRSRGLCLQERFGAELGADGPDCRDVRERRGALSGERRAARGAPLAPRLVAGGLGEGAELDAGAEACLRVAALKGAGVGVAGARLVAGGLEEA